MVINFKVSLQTRANFDVINITSAVQAEVSNRGFTTGIILICTPSSTSALITTEI